MKKPHTPLGWRKPDARRYRFALPNSIWQYKLKPKAFVVLCYLVYWQGHGDGAPLTAEQIMNGVHMSKEVTKKNLDALRSTGLVNEDGALSDVVRDLSTGFFSLPNEVFLLNLSPGALSVYAYLLCCENRGTRKCYPSYKTIATHTRMCVSTAEKCITELVDKGLIAVERSAYPWHGLKRTGNNCYTILPVCGAVDDYHHCQLRRLEQEATRRKVQKKLEAFDRSHPNPAA